MAETAVTTSHVVSDRIVFTYGEYGNNSGVITGFIDDHLSFVVEHVIVLKAGCLIPMLKAGMLEAKGFGCSTVSFGIPDDFVRGQGLAAAASRVGCEVYAHEDGITFYRGVL